MTWFFIDAQRHDDDTPTIALARAIAATFALQQALPAALSGDAASLADGLSTYRDLSPAGYGAPRAEQTENGSRA
jgi:hypothetical protein